MAGKNFLNTHESPIITANPGQEPCEGGVATGNIGTTTQTDQKLKMGKRMLTDLSDKDIIKFLTGKYYPEQNTDRLAVGNLFKITKTIIDHATDNSIVDNILQPVNAQSEKISTGNESFSFISPLCILKSICCEMSSCKIKGGSGEEISILTSTELIFDKLKPYSWEAKAVLALAAFALEYGDFWHLAQLYGQCDQLTKSVAILKGVPALIKHPTLQNRKSEVGELNKLIKATLQVTDRICQVEDLYNHSHTNDVPTLDTAVTSIPTYVFWTITTIVACAVNVTHLTSDEEKPYQLSYLVTKIEGIREILEEQHESCKKEMEVIYNYKKLLRMMKNTRKISEAINILILPNDENVEKPPIITVGSSVKEVITGETFVNAVKEDYVLFYISSLENITADDILCLEEVHEEIRIKKTNRNLITVWIPIVEDWTENQMEKFKLWGSRMPWYKVQFFSPAVIMYLKKEWSYTGTAMAVLMNPKGKLQYTNALSLIRTHEINFLDFLDNEMDSLFLHVFRLMKDEKLEAYWSKDERKCIFFCGGADELSIHKWQKKVDRANVSIKEYSVSIELYIPDAMKAKAGEEQNYSETQKSFWSGIEGMYFSLANHNKKEYKTVANELRKLLSYKKLGEWVMVSQGSKLIACGRPSTIFKVVENIDDQWKQKLSLKIPFRICFREFHDKVIADDNKKIRPDNYEFEISGKSPKDMEYCPVCDLPAEITSVSYKCCHPGIPKN